MCLNGAPLNWATAGTRDMRRFVTRPVIVLKGPGPWPSRPAPVSARVKPTKTWGPGGPNSVKNCGSLGFTQASMPGCPSIVVVWIHCSPPGARTLTVYLPIGRFSITA